MPSLLIFSSLFIVIALFIHQTTSPVFSATANAWNLEKATSTNNLDFYYDVGGVKGLQLRPSGASILRDVRVNQQANTVGNGLQIYNTGNAQYTAIYTGGDNASYFQNNNGFLQLDANGDLRTTKAGLFGNNAPGYSATALTGSSNSGAGVYGQSISNVGVYGNSTTNAGVWGNSTSGYGVSGTSTNNVGTGGVSTSNIGTYGQSTSNMGVYGLSTSGSGVVGVSTSQYGVYGVSTDNIGVYGHSTNQLASFFYAQTYPTALSARSDSSTAGWTTLVERTSDSVSGGGLLLLNAYSNRNDSTSFLLYGQSDANNNQGGVDVEFYVRADGEVRADGTIQGGGADVAEWTPSKEAKTLQPGDLVMVDGTNPNALTKKSDGTPYSPKLMGIISTKPGLVAGGQEVENDHTNDVLVALSGRVPAKVSTENGEIKPGDFLTSSSTPGVAMKATKSGMVIGKALESFGESNIGKITVWVDTFWYGGETNKGSEQTQIDQLKKEISELKNKIK